jgi:hypothetical protein
MTWEEWIPPLLSSAVLLILGVLLKHKFNSELEKLKAKLRRKDDELAAIRSGAIDRTSISQPPLNRPLATLPTESHCFCQ